MRTVELRGGRHAVLLIHGLKGTPIEVLPLAKRLQKAGYTVKAPYYKGYGYTKADSTIPPWRVWHADTLAEFRALKAEYDSVSIAGLCMGAVLALSAAEELGDEVAALSLLSTTLYYDGWTIPWYRFLLPLGYYTPFRYLYTYKGSEPYGVKNPELQSWIAREIDNQSSSIAAAANLSLPCVYEGERLIRKVRKQLPQVTAPTLIIHAEEDDVCSPRSARLVEAKVSSRQTKLVLLHDSYHMITLDNEREKVADETVAFFNQVTGHPN